MPYALQRRLAAIAIATAAGATTLAGCGSSDSGAPQTESGPASLTY